ncbi:amidohydrolase [Arsukibacterium indicum]|uniref:Amidohydrolase n=1 Tax=Arsukibacterium indicum TaxID=2848612 RepID=A0ABS6MK37_9GAMM|nr:amidohydrolase [Arsukibacterium indicum]MBV2129187.1 amidohydrolase [Arsukibacterium indicum]
MKHCKITLLASLMIAGAASAEPVLLHNVKGYGFNSDRELVSFTALAFDDTSGKVLARGDKTLQTQFVDARRVDGGGKTVLPGLIDGHGHLLGLGEELSQADLRGQPSEEAAVKVVADFARSQPQAAWIIGRGWNQVLWDSKQFPTTALLDEAIGDRPVWLTRIDGHAGWANSKALALAGITKDTLDPPGGKIIRDADGNPTGVLMNNARRYIARVLPATSTEDNISALQAAFQQLLSLGITSVHDAGISSELATLYQQLAADGKLPIRIYAMLSSRNADLADWLAGGIWQEPADWLSIRSVKIYGDGALGSRGAALLSDYSDQPGHTGLLVTQPDALTQIMQLTINAGFQANVHAIGDRANRLVLDRFEQLATAEQRLAGRHRIEHAQIVAPDDIPRFKTLNVLPSMQAVHATSDKNMAGDRLGVARLRGAYAWRSFIDQGSIIVGGSDFPVELANPFHGLHASVTRQDQQNQPQGGWLPEQRLTLVEALRSFTVDAAYGAFQEDNMGTLAPGSWADFILIDQDIFSIDPSQLWQVQTEQTWVHGQLRFQQAAD